MICPDCGGKKYRRNPDLRTRMQLGELPEDYVRRAATLGDARARALRSGTHLKPWPVDMGLPKSIPPSARYFRSLLVGLPSDLVVSFAVDVTERVLPIYEHDSPSDYGYQQRALMTEAIEAARRWVKDPCCMSDRPIHSARCPLSPNRMGDRGTKSWHHRGTTLLLAPGSPIMWRSPSYAAVAAAYAAHAVPRRGPARADGLLLPDRTEIAWQKQRLIEYLLGEVQVQCHCPSLDLFRYGCKCGGRRNRRRLRRRKNPLKITDQDPFLISRRNPWYRRKAHRTEGARHGLWATIMGTSPRVSDAYEVTYCEYTGCEKRTYDKKPFCIDHLEEHLLPTHKRIQEYMEELDQITEPGGRESRREARERRERIRSLVEQHLKGQPSLIIDEILRILKRTPRLLSSELVDNLVWTRPGAVALRYRTGRAVVVLLDELHKHGLVSASFEGKPGVGGPADDTFISLPKLDGFSKD